MNPWLAIAAAAVPEIQALVLALIALRRKYPSLTPEEINGAVSTITGQADTAFDDVLKKIAADHLAHPGAA